MSAEPIRGELIRLERVQATVRRAVPPRPGAPDPEPALAAGPEIAEYEGRALTPADAVPVATVGLVGLFSGEIVVSVLAGVAALGALALRRLAVRERFGFGDGFQPFRSDMGWPSGVQEDDDFHWSWSRQSEEAAPTTRRPIPR